MMITDCSNCRRSADGKLCTRNGTSCTVENGRIAWKPVKPPRVCVECGVALAGIRWTLRGGSGNRVDYCEQHHREWSQQNDPDAALGRAVRAKMLPYGAGLYHYVEQKYGYCPDGSTPYVFYATLEEALGLPAPEVSRNPGELDRGHVAHYQFNETELSDAKKRIAALGVIVSGKTTTPWPDKDTETYALEFAVALRDKALEIAAEQRTPGEYVRTWVASWLKEARVALDLPLAEPEAEGSDGR